MEESLEIARGRSRLPLRSGIGTEETTIWSIRLAAGSPVGRTRGGFHALVRRGYLAGAQVAMLLSAYRFGVVDISLITETAHMLTCLG